MENDREFDVIVIGGGLSGLVASLYLQERGASVLLLEARDRVGGRTCTAKTENLGVNVDVGGAYVGPGQDRILRYAKMANIETYKVYDEGKIIVDLNGMRSSYSGKIPKIGIFPVLDLNTLIIETYKLCKELDIVNKFQKEPWNCKKAEKYDKISVREWVNKQVWSKTAKQVYNFALEAVLCADPSEVSLLYWLFYVKSSDGVMRLTTVSNGAQERKFKGGSQAISNFLFDKIQNKNLNSPVREIHYDENKCTVFVNGNLEEKIEKFYSKRVLIAFSPTLYSKIRFSPPLPSCKTHISQHMPMGSIIKTNLFYKTAFWRTKGFNGQFLSDSGPISYAIDDTKHDGKFPSLMGFCLSTKCREWMTKTKEERKNAIMIQYANIFENDEALKPIDYIEKNWCEEEWSLGCYVGIMGPQVMSKFGKNLRNPHKTIYFAGTELATGSIGYMDGAVESGERAAHEILTDLSSFLTNIEKPPRKLPKEKPSIEIPNLPNLPEVYEWYIPSSQTTCLFLLIVFVFFVIYFA